MNPQVRSYLAQKYGFQDDLSDDALKNGMDQLQQAQFMNSLSRAGTTIGAAFSGTKPDYSFNNQMDQVAQAPIENLMARRKLESDNLAFQNAQIKGAKEQSLLDPESQDSVAFRKIVETNFPTVAKAYGDSWNSVSAADRDILFQPMQLKEQIEARRQNSALSLMDRKLSIMDKLNANKDIERLPMEDREAVKDLAKKNAAKQSIANQIDSVVKILENPNISEDQKLAQGRQLLKTLNSTEGADAIGKEEAERLGSFLNFHMMNFTQPGPVIGRDTGAFTNQAKLTSSAVKNAINSNEKIMAEKYQRSGVPRSVPQSSWETKKQQAFEWANQHPDDPRAKEILKRLGNV